MRAIHPLLDNNVIQRKVILDDRGYAVDYHWELV
jgi:hypothetical protein